ncbi:M56 family metallopeptidase [Sediminibacterium soli]|uniref:M56 family metallopeptidase n=1 Tax=Sediminibacterium soli TaxID=2698829 RepID=UPI00137B2C94|nr:M56 family metallopeptidase [Sediminibacterium soli]NCI45638.1 M48 family metalloprotease [Sediminibacterium soli]
MQVNLFSTELVRAICWTLLHSVWQGVLLAMATGLVMLFTRSARPQKRYLMLVGLFLFFVVTAVVTFVSELNRINPRTGGHYRAEQGVYQSRATEPLLQAAATGTVTATPLQRFVSYFNEHAAMVVLVWFLIFLAKLIRLGANLVYVQRLRSYRTTAPGGQWREVLQRLMQQLAIDRTVRLLESGILKVPVTIGMLKPVILLPMGLLSHLPPDEIEAILLHELAHIKRRDYFVNLLQSFAETVFFFNPALLWLSSMIREERENCCDELAISVTNNKTNFINALISFQEYHFADQRCGMAFPGSRNQLLNRVKRIVHNKNKTLNTMEKSILTLAIAAFLLFSFVNARKAPVNTPIHTSGETKSNIADKIHAPVPFPRNTTSRIPVTDTVIREKKAAAPNETEKTVVEEQAATGTTALRPPDASLTGLKPLSPLSDTLPDQFKSMSTTLVDDGKDRILEFTAKTKDGREYRLKKVNDTVKELYLNGKQIPESEFGQHMDEIRSIEQRFEHAREEARKKREEAGARRMESEKLRVEAMNRKREVLQDRRLAEISKRQMVVEEQRAVREHKLHEIRERQTLELQKHLQSDSIHLRKQERQLELKRLYLEKESEHLKERRKDSIRHVNIEMNSKSAVLAQLNHGRSELRLPKEARLNQVNLKLKNGQQYRNPEYDAGTKPVRIIREKLPADTAKTKPRSKQGGDNMPLSKREALRLLRAGDETRREASAAVMRNIISDLANENIIVDPRTGWFALDKKQFLVDGKEMSREQQNRFRAKYLVADGVGFYYGNVTVPGKGIFLSNREVSAK